jgi:hypothetical protein
MEIFLLPRIVCTERMLQEFQYKIVHDYLITNKQLKIYKIKESNLCDLCNEYVETIEHIFWDWAKTKTIWLQFQEWWLLWKTRCKMKNITKTIVLYLYFATHANNLSQC